MAGNLASNFFSRNQKFFRNKFVIASIFILFIFLLFILIILKDLPSPKKLASYEIPQTTKILDRNGQLLYEIYADQNRTLIKLEEVPDFLRQATVAVEDKDFYRHKGVSLIGGVLRAIKENIFKQELQGGSTITQQLVKNALLSSERTFSRKIKEIILAFWTESIYDKNQILEMYLNQVPFGGTAWGIEAASEMYFCKKTGNLTLAESAYLAGLPAAPTTYSPYGAH